PTATKYLRCRNSIRYLLGIKTIAKICWTHWSGSFHTRGNPTTIQTRKKRSGMKALVVNALGGGFDLEDVQVAAPIGREVLVDVQASGLCHTDLLFATHDIVPMPAVLGHEVAGIVA